MVSVVMALYNEPPEIVSAAIRSILDQTYRNFELLIFDDSTDPGTLAAIDSFCADPRVRLSRGAERVGFVRSLNLGLEAAAGEYIARMDGDDISLPDRFEKQVAFLEEHPRIDAAGGQIDIIDGAGTAVSHRKYPCGRAGFYFYSILRNPIAHPTVMMRASLVREGYRYNESLVQNEDLDLWLRMMRDSHRILNMRDTLLRYRVTDNFLEKRATDARWQYLLDVRKMNFSRRRWLHSALGVAAAWAFANAPSGVMKSIYNRENGNV